jgi:Tn3 transposase DDE domain
LGLVVNTGTLWNILYPDESAHWLREEGEVADVNLTRVSPLSHSHINVLGRYSFELDESLTGEVCSR